MERDAGDLEGCWYTRVETSKDLGAPSGVYMEGGSEVFVGTLKDGPEGVFATAYKFESKWVPDVSTGTEVHGVTGRVDFKDDVATGLYYYRGHLALG